MGGDQFPAGLHGLSAQAFARDLALQVFAGGDAHHFLERRGQLGIIYDLRRFDHLADLRPADGLDHDPVSPGQLKPGRIEVVDLDPAPENDPYDLGH